MTHRQLPQSRAIALTAELLVDPGLFRPERSVPAAARRIDAEFEVREPRDGWGVLRPVVAHRQVLLEHFSRPPAGAKAATCVAKLAHVADEWWNARGERPPGQRRPLLLVVSDGPPRKLLELLGNPRRGVSEGIWASPLFKLADVNVVDVRGLPLGDPGTGVLRFYRLFGSEGEAAAAVSALRDDPQLLPSTKEKLMEALMNRTIPTTSDEYAGVYQRLVEQERKSREEGREEGREQGREQGREEGREQGREEGRRALLELAARNFGPKEVAALEAIDDLTELTDRMGALLSGSHG